MNMNMFSGKDAVNPAYPTQWAMNPTAYQNMDSSQVDWAALAQQWIAMKDAAVIVGATTSKPDVEEGEAPMEVENPDCANADSSDVPQEQWNATSNSWGNNWNQWGWGWPGAGPVDPTKPMDPSMAMPAMVDGYPVPDTAAAMTGYTTGSVPGGPTFQHGYWTASQEQLSAPSSRSSGHRRSKSKNRDSKSSSRPHRSHRDKPQPPPPAPEPALPPGALDAAKRRQLPAWIREGLEKMEREKQKAIEREQEMKAREIAEAEKKKLEEEELARMKAAASGEPMLPPKSKFESESEGEESDKELPPAAPEQPPPPPPAPAPPPPRAPSPPRSKEEVMQEVMLAVRRSLTEILLEVTDQEIHSVSQEELARYTAAQGLGAYESSGGESEPEDDIDDVTDQQLQEQIKRKRLDFERTSREIEAEVKKAELREEGGEPATPEPDARGSVTPPPVESDTPEKIPERRPSKDKRNNHKPNDRVDGVRRLESIPEEKKKSNNKREHTPSPPPKVEKKKTSSSSSSDSEQDSPSSSSHSDSDSEAEHKEKKTKKHKRKSSSDSSNKKSKKKKEKSSKYDNDRESKSKRYDDDYEKSKSKKRDDRDDYYDKSHKSRSRDYSHRDRYRDDSDDERRRRRKRSRSRSNTYESRRSRRVSEERSRRRDRRSHDREKRSYDRDRRSYDRDRSHDRYERARDERRRSRSRSRSRHRR